MGAEKMFGGGQTAQIIRGEQVDPVELQEDERIRERVGGFVCARGLKKLTLAWVPASRSTSSEQRLVLPHGRVR